LLLCARTRANRTWLSTVLREGTTLSGAGTASRASEAVCTKLYEAWLVSHRLQLRPGERIAVTTLPSDANPIRAWVGCGPPLTPR